MTIVAIRPLFIIVTLMALILMVVLHMWTFGAGWSSVLVLFFLMITHFCLVTYDLPGVLMRMYRSEFFFHQLAMQSGVLRNLHKLSSWENICFIYNFTI